MALSQSMELDQDRSAFDALRNSRFLLNRRVSVLDFRMEKLT